MQRVIYVKGSYKDEKYCLRNEYNNFGIYQKKTPNGFFVHQDFLISNGDVTVVCPSFNNLCEEEILDMIDDYNKKKKFGKRVMVYPNKTYLVHPNGKEII